MAGIYIHIPFCKQKCYYCNFYSVASIKNKDRFLEVLKKEIYHQRKYLKNEIVNTIYFGGGTPSMFSKNEIEDVYAELIKHFNIGNSVEVTVEANPDDLSKKKLDEFKSSIINRLSIGIQSFFDGDLHYLNRTHDSKQAINSIRWALDSGFSNLSIDLIYGIPTLSLENWKRNLELFFELNIPHLSSYALTIEPKTPLKHLIEKKKIAAINEKDLVAHFDLLLELTEMNDFIHYEISNFSKKGYYSKHNSLYWLGRNYLGLGPSAHSFNGLSRQWNISNLTQYLKHTNSKSIIQEREVLTTAQKYNEYVMTSIRTLWGCDLEHINNVFGKTFRNHCLKASQKHILSKQLLLTKNVLYLTSSGKIFADGITADLFINS
ncbi:MAG: radical SAM family heme chaperone HemW [Bacteroidetes bacterium]|nr:radical SAM family heme chaperone HemW [Bacteroidota bacterium]